MHIVEQLIAERATRLMSRERLFRAIRPALWRLLGYDAAVFLADAVSQRTGRDAFRFVADHLRARVAVRGLSRVPREGACLIIGNHPTGLADGIAVFEALRNRRPNHVYLANADALRVVPRGEDIIIPVEWRNEKRTRGKSRQTLIDMKRAVSDGKAIVIFPSGRLAQLTLRGLREHPWQTSAAMVAKKYGVPVIPMRIQARNSALYYLISKLNHELRDITLFHELLNKKGELFRIDFGEAIPPEALSENAEDATAFIQRAVGRL